MYQGRKFLSTQLSSQMWPFLCSLCNRNLAFSHTLAILMTAVIAHQLRRWCPWGLKPSKLTYDNLLMQKKFQQIWIQYHRKIFKNRFQIEMSTSDLNDPLLVPSYPRLLLTWIAHDQQLANLKVEINCPWQYRDFHIWITENSTTLAICAN